MIRDLLRCGNVPCYSVLVIQIIYWLHHQIACYWMIICNYANMTCCINVSSKIDRIYNCECSHNCDMWCSKIVIASKYHNCSPLLIVILEYVDLLIKPYWQLCTEVFVKSSLFYLCYFATSMAFSTSKLHHIN